MCLPLVLNKGTLQTPSAKRRLQDHLYFCKTSTQSNLNLLDSSVTPPPSRF